MLGSALPALGINRITLGIMLESAFARQVVCKSTCLSILTAWDTLASLKMSQ